MVEIVIAFCVVGLSFGVYVSTALAVRRQASGVQELALASDACQRMVETLRAEAFDELVLRYGADSANDPKGPGTAPGPHFDVAGLRPADGDADGHVGELLLPEVEVQNGVWQLREDAQRPELGLPRDLNGDSILDDDDHSSDYLQLPVCVRVRWQGRTGPRTYELDALLTPFRR